jgi:hypothetical protein
MKKTLFVFIVFALAIQIAIAQRGRVVIVYFHNGSIVKGEISKLPNEERFKIQTPNGSIILFASQEVRDLLYEDGTRPGDSNSQYQTRPQYQQPQQRTSPPAYQQNQVNPPYQQQTQPQNNKGNARVEPEEVVDENLYGEDIYDEDFYDGDIDFTFEDTDIPVNTKPAAQTSTVTPQGSTEFVPGYHGFVDFGYTIGMGDSAHAFNRMELTITQGYQFSPSLFAGLGMGVHMYSDSVPLRKIENSIPVVSSLSYVFPVFVDIRYNLSNGSIKPFAALKAGYGIGLSKTSTDTTDPVTGERSRKTEYKAENLGFYVAPSLGTKFMIGRSLAFNVGLGYSMQFFNDKTLKPSDPTKIINKTDFMGGVTLKAGLEF